MRASFGLFGVLTNLLYALSGAKLVLTSTIPFSKRYLKYLTKKFLKKNQLEVSFRRMMIDHATVYKCLYIPVL